MSARKYLAGLGIEEDRHIMVNTGDPDGGECIILYDLLQGFAESKFNNVGLADVSQQRELLIAFVDWAEKEEQSELNNYGLVEEWLNKSNS